MPRRNRAASTATPDEMAGLADDIAHIGTELGLDALGIADTTPFEDTRIEMERRVAEGLADTMRFTYADPSRSTDPSTLLPNTAALVVGARSYRRADVAEHDDAPHGRIGRYAWVDHYAPLKAALDACSLRIRADGWRTRVLADDNALVDRAAAQRAGIGWIGKNANLLLPGRGSWFVLGSLATSAPLRPSAGPVEDSCGTCVRCIDGCPTAAIVAPGVVDARRCLAWLAQRPGVFPEEFAASLGDRIYGCDDCQEVCPPNRSTDRRNPPPPAEDRAQPWTPLLTLATADDDELLAMHGRFYLPGRDPSTLRRNAVIALGNGGDPHDARVRSALDQALDHRDEGVRAAATWAVVRLARR